MNIFSLAFATGISLVAIVALFFGGILVWFLMTTLRIGKREIKLVGLIVLGIVCVIFRREIVYFGILAILFGGATAACIEVLFLNRIGKSFTDPLKRKLEK